MSPPPSSFSLTNLASRSTMARENSPRIQRKWNKKLSSLFPAEFCEIRCCQIHRCNSNQAHRLPRKCSWRRNYLRRNLHPFPDDWRTDWRGPVKVRVQDQCCTQFHRILQIKLLGPLKFTRFFFLKALLLWRFSTVKSLGKLIVGDILSVHFENCMSHSYFKQALWAIYRTFSM